MSDLIDMRVPGLGLAPARHNSAINEAERLAYFGDKFDRTKRDACVDEVGQSGTRRATRATGAAAGLSAR